MVKKVVTQYVDDIDGSDAEGSVTFSYDGVTYEVDLSSKNKDKLEKALQPFIDASRKVGGRRSSSGRGKSNNLAAISAWAKDNNHEVSERGRIPAAVIAAYEAAH